jgi:hypothetical protein
LEPRESPSGVQGFYELPADVMPSERLIYWGLVSFGKTSGNDAGKLHKVFLQLEQHWIGLGLDPYRSIVDSSFASSLRFALCLSKLHVSY